MTEKNHKNQRKSDNLTRTETLYAKAKQLAFPIIVTSLATSGTIFGVDLTDVFKPEFTAEQKKDLLDNAHENKKFRQEAEQMLKEYKDSKVHFSDIVDHMEDKNVDQHLTFKEHSDLFVSKKAICKKSEKI